MTELLKTDVAIVGGGLAGLTAARRLTAAGVECVVLEARDRVGGRTLNQPIPGGEIVEGGAEYVGPTQTEVVALARELGLDTFPTYTEGQTVLYLGGNRMLADDDGIAAALAPGTSASRLDGLACAIPLERPWEAEDAERLDAMTVEDWLIENSVEGAARLTIDLGTAATLGAEPQELSLLWFLYYIRSAGGLLDLLATRGGAQDSRIEGGTQMISIKMAEALGERVRLSAPVRSVEGWADGPVRIEGDGFSVEAQRVIVAMMPTDMQRIDFTPALPDARRGLIEMWTASHANFKGQLVYETAFWRGDGLSGQVLSDSDPQITFDNSPQSGTPGVILGFINPDVIPDGHDARRDWLAGRLARYFGEEALSPIAYVEQDWSLDEWTAGCVSPLVPGVLTSAGPALREPNGRLHWAGTETADVWNGYMDGAVRSGTRAAEEVIASLAAAGG